MNENSTKINGQFMLKCRLALGLSQSQLANIFGYKAFETILRKEKGKQDVGLVEILALKYLMQEAGKPLPETGKAATVAS
jgi:transcriptional regulator with XRE-family HTH domain